MKHKNRIKAEKLAQQAQGDNVPMQFDEPEMPIDSYSSGSQFDVHTKSKKATTKKAVPKKVQVKK